MVMFEGEAKEGGEEGRESVVRGIDRMKERKEIQNGSKMEDIHWIH